MAQTSTKNFERQHLLEHVRQLTIRPIHYPETMIREVQKCSGRRHDDLYQSAIYKNPKEVSSTK